MTKEKEIDIIEREQGWKDKNAWFKEIIKRLKEELNNPHLNEENINEIIDKIFTEEFGDLK